MFASIEAAQAYVGSSQFVGLDDLLARLVYKSGAGTPTATSTVPDFIGQLYLDTAASKWYLAEDTDDVNGFLILN